MCGQSLVPVLFFNGAVLGAVQKGGLLALKRAPLVCLLRLPSAAASRIGGSKYLQPSRLRAKVQGLLAANKRKRGGKKSFAFQ